jgi:hypothetical protein
MQGWIALLIALITAAGGIYQVWLPLQQIEKNSVGSLAEGQKICRAIVPDRFSDGLIVPRNWSADNCAVYASKIGATHYFLGCIRANAQVDFGDREATPPIAAAPIPKNNCGW